MDSAFAWVGQIAEWFGQFVPKVKVVNSTMRGVKFKNGTTPVLIEPGLCWWWPLRSEIKLYPFVRQSVDMKSQVMSSADNKTFIVGGVLEYEVTDMLTLLTSLWSVDTTIQNIAAGAITDVLTRPEWKQLQNLHASGMLKIEVRRELRKRLRPLGVRVIRVTFTDFAPARVYKLVNSNSIDG